MRELSVQEQTVVAAAARFGRDVIEPNAETWNAAGHVPRSFFTEAAAQGLCRLIVPGGQGGLGLSVTAMARVTETLAAHCLASTFALVVHNNLAGAIARHANASQAARYLPGMMHGEIIGAFLLTEPGVGSDAAAIGTTAESTDGGWLLNGEKAWISNAATADLLSVYAQTDTPGRARGIASFLVEAEKSGVRRTKPYALMGGHALGTGGFEFTNVKLTGESVLIPAGEGFRAAMTGIDIARVNVAAMCTGVLSRAISEAVSYVSKRPAFGHAVGDFQGVQWMLAECATDLEAARLLARAAAALIDRGERASVAAAHAKKFASRAAFARTSDCMQTMGAAGFSREYPLARHLEAAKMAQYLDGATEIQNVVIARALMAGDGESG